MDVLGGPSPHMVVPQLSSTPLNQVKLPMHTAMIAQEIKPQKEVDDTEAALISWFRMELDLKPPMIAGTWHPQPQLWFPGPCLQEGWRVGLASRT